jgi:hypothetical protein
MLKNAFALGLVAALVAGSALAAGGEKPKKDVGQYVDISPVALPIVVNGTLVNYVFINVRIMLSTQANVVKLREKEPYFRDALVRAGHRSPFTKADDYNVVDAARMKATASAGFTTATDLADWLVRVLGMPFREAHHATGRIVRAEEKGCDIADLSLADMQAIEPRIDKSVFKVLGVENSVASRTSFGGTAPANVKKAVVAARRRFL